MKPSDVGQKRSTQMNSIKYDSNNSGGNWWLDDEDWVKLEAAGWKVDWVKDQPESMFRSKGQERWLGALATSATREGLTEDQAIAEFEAITGQRASDPGCSCCGQPHNFYVVDAEGNMVF
jgi:hypothetical protein